MHWADASDGIILMENLKAKGLTMLDRVNGEGKWILQKNFALDSLKEGNLKLRHEINGQRDEFKIRIEKLQVVHSLNHTPYVNKVFSLVQEKTEKKKHYLILLLQK